MSEIVSRVGYLELLSRCNSACNSLSLSMTLSSHSFNELKSLTSFSALSLDNSEVIVLPPFCKDTRL